MQNELKLHNLKIAVDMQKASVEATDKEMREFAEQDFNPAMQEAERAKEAEARINATEKELKQHIEEEYKKKRAAFEESFAKYRSDMLGDLEERKAESIQRIDDAIRRLNQKTFQGKSLIEELHLGHNLMHIISISNDSIYSKGVCYISQATNSTS